MCPGYLAMPSVLAKIMDTEPEKVQVFPAGINHCTWILDHIVRGQDGYPLLREL